MASPPPSRSGPPLSPQQTLETESAPEGSNIYIQSHQDPVTGAEMTTTHVDRPDGTGITSTSVTQDGVTSDVGSITSRPDGTIEIWDEKTGTSQTRNPDGSIDIWNENTGEQTHIPPPEPDPGEAAEGDETSDEDPTECTNCGPPEGSPEPSFWESFGKGLWEGVKTGAAFLIGGVAATAGLVFLGMSAPIAGALVAGVMLGVGVYGLYEVISNWDTMTSPQRVEFFGGVVGGLIVGGAAWGLTRPKPPRIPKPPPEELPPPKPPPEEPPPGGRPPKPNEPIPVNNLPHNEFLRSPQYAEGVANGAPRLRPVGPNGGGFLNAQAGPIQGPKVLYRVGNRNGTWWSEEPPPRTMAEWRNRDGVIPDWNDGTQFWQIRIPEGQQIPSAWKGPGAPAHQEGITYPSGHPQINLNPTTLPSEWFTEFTHVWK